MKVKAKGWFALFTAILLLIAGCDEQNAGVRPTATAGADDEGQPVEEQSLRVLTNRVDLIENGVLAGYAERFSELHPGAVIEFEGLTNYASDIMVRLSTRNLGDVLLLPNNMKNESFPDYFEPLGDELFEGMRFADFKSHQGKRYGIATGISTSGIVYNKEAFRKAGITDVPTTLEQFYEACEKLKRAGIVPVYLNYGAKWPLMSWGEDLVSYMTGDPEYLNRMTETDEPFRADNAWGEAITIVRTLIEKGYVEQGLISNQWETSKQELASGRAGMYLMGNWVINQVVSAGADSDTIGFFPFPYDNSGKRYAPLSPDWFAGISKFSENKELASAWITFFVRESGYVDASGFLPVEEAKESELPQIRQFMSYEPFMVEKSAPSDRLMEIAAAAQIPFWSGDNIQEWIAAPELEDVFGQYNERWREARNISER
ncbi:ABC transporter substrate-binding protein [Paenibacillus soyae]|uniref:Extracellular solute-binding protein n=1 Tax=Paenibacillus soyae TaxID=2969249 RepID=A0A9X2MTM3_9BACL|nr:extracellular solute-binding protein [Paenibacillus soyae]MCR2806072.1 extracellular solute-binding protein [Paenibacillus soyae]